MLQRDVVKARAVIDPSSQTLRQFICSEILNGRGTHGEIEPVTQRIRSAEPASQPEPITQRLVRPCFHAQPCAVDPCPAIIEMTSMGIVLDFAPEGGLQVVELDEDDFEESEETSYGEQEGASALLPPIG